MTLAKFIVHVFLLLTLFHLSASLDKLALLWQKDGMSVTSLTPERGFQCLEIVLLHYLIWGFPTHGESEAQRHTAVLEHENLWQQTSDPGLFLHCTSWPTSTHFVEGSHRGPEP